MIPAILPTISFFCLARKSVVWACVQNGFVVLKNSLISFQNGGTQWGLFLYILKGKV